MDPEMSEATQDEWELSKENVQPLKQGRKMANLTAALQPQTSDQLDRLREERLQFETEIRICNDQEDPMEMWDIKQEKNGGCTGIDMYIKWTEQNFPRGGKDSHLLQLLERCVRHFKETDRYKNDVRYVQAWIKFVRLFSEPLQMYDLMFSQGIGLKVAEFYDAWAWDLEQYGSTKKADQVYKQGLEAPGQPLEWLRKKHAEFQARVARQGVTSDSTDEPNQMMAVGGTEEPQRATLGALKFKGKHGTVPVNRATGLSHGSQGPLKTSNRSLENNSGTASFAVYSDGNVAAQPRLPSQTDQPFKVPSRGEVNRENEQKPSMWTKAKIKPKKAAPVVPIEEVSSYNKPSFAIHEDPNLAQPQATPRKIPVMNQVLSAKKPERPVSVAAYMSQPDPQEMKQKPMYCKHLVYAGTDEFSFEEIRAARFRDRQRKIEQRKLEEERMELEKKQEELRRGQEAMEQIELRTQQELQRQKQEFLENMRQEMEQQLQAERQKMQEQLSNLMIRQTTQTVSEQNQPIHQQESQSNASLHLGTSHQGSNETATPMEASQHYSPKNQPLGREQRNSLFQPPLSQESTERSRVNSQELEDIDMTDKPACEPPEQKTRSLARVGLNFKERGTDVCQALMFDQSIVQNENKINATSLREKPSMRSGRDVNVAAPPRERQPLRSQTLASSFSEESSQYVTPNTTQSSAGSKCGDPTPDSSSLNPFLRSWERPSSGSGKLTAPSPTVNTKEAFQVVMGMFNQTLDVNNQFGWQAGHNKEDEDFEAQFTGDAEGPGLTTRMLSITGRGSTPFTIFDDSDKDRQPPAPAASQKFTIFSDEDNKENKTSSKIPNQPQLGGKQPLSRPASVKSGIQGERPFCETQPSFTQPQPSFSKQQPLFNQPQSSFGQPQQLFSQRQASFSQPQPTGQAQPMTERAQRNRDLDVEMEDEVLASNTEQTNCQVNMDCNQIEFDPGNLTFIPNFSSTRNFSELARMVSTPFNPSGEAPPLPATHLSNIKAGSQPVTDADETALTAEPVDHTNDAEGTNEEGSRRSSVFRGGQFNLSPIIEQSDEDVKLANSLASTASSASHQSTGSSHHTLGASHSTLHHVTMPAHSIIGNGKQGVSMTSEQSHLILNGGMHMQQVAEQSIASSDRQSVSRLHATLPTHPVFSDPPDDRNPIFQSQSSNPITRDESLHSANQNVSNERQAMQSFQTFETSYHNSKLKPPSVPDEDEDEVISNKTCHEIDITNYIQDDMKEKTAYFLNMSIAIDPHDPFDEELIARFLRRLPVPITSYHNYHRIDDRLPTTIKAHVAVALGGEVYTVESLVGEGGFAKVYHAVLETDDDMAIIEDKVIKVQKPPCPWEFYMVTEVHKRLEQLQAEFDVRPAIMKIDHGYFFDDASCLVSDIIKDGTLLDFVNRHRTAGIQVHPHMAVYLTIELLHIVEQLHACKMIHGDIKPDNFLFRGFNRLATHINPTEWLTGSSNCVKLIDWGQSIDMTMFPAGTTFMAKIKTSGFQCVEMKTDQPWTYQTDLFGLIGTIHVILYGEYMKVSHRNGNWCCHKPIKRYGGGLWARLFEELLNVPSCDEIPDLAAHRQVFEDYIRTKHFAIAKWGIYRKGLDM